MFLKAEPIGTSQPLYIDRERIWTAVSGDDLVLTTNITCPGTVEPATAVNSILVFKLASTRFDSQALYTATWGNGITAEAGLIQITLPPELSQTLRRGGYVFSMTASTAAGKHLQTVLKGTLLIEYEPTSPNHNIPYRSDSNG